MRAGPAVGVRLFGRFEVRLRTGTTVALSDRRRALLAALVAADRPLTRSELNEAVGIGRTTLGPLLSRLASEDLGLDRPIHRQVDRRQGLIELDRELVGSDVADIRATCLVDRAARSGTLAAGHTDPGNGGGIEAATTLADLGALGRPVALGLVDSHSLTAELMAGLDGLHRRAVSAIAWASLADPERAPSLVGLPHPPLDPPELVLAYVDDLTRRAGAEEAKRAVGELVDRLPVPHAGSGRLGTADLARLVIETVPAAGPLAPTIPTVDDRRRADVVVNALRATASRVVLVHDQRAPETSIACCLDAVRNRFPAAIGRWLPSDLAGSAATAALIEEIVAKKVRRPDGHLRPRLLIALAALLDDRPLEPDSTARWFTRDVAAVLRDWATGEAPVLVVGRRAALDDDLDRVLADLLRLVPDLRLVIVHTERPDTDGTGDGNSDGDGDGAGDGGPLSEFDAEQITVSSGSGTVRTTSVPRHTSVADHDETGGRDSADDTIGRLLAVSSYSVDADHRLHRPLADHLLAAVGAVTGIDEVITLGRRTGALDEVDRFTAEPGYWPERVGMAPGDRDWLASTAIRWLIEGRLRGRRELSIVRRLLDALPPGHPIGGLPTALEAPAALAVSHGDFDLATDLLDLAVATSQGAERAAVMASRGDCHRDRGRWDLALGDYLSAAERTVATDGDPRVLADLALRAARLTWDPTVADRVDRMLVDAIDWLPPEETLLRARLELCLAGGSFQDGSAGTDRLTPAEIEAALDTALTAYDPSARAWALVHARKALLGVVPVDRSSRWAERVLAEANLDVAALAHGQQARFVDGLRLADWRVAGRALRQIERLAQTPVSVEQRFSAVVARTCWNLLQGRFAEAESGLATERAFQASLGGSTHDQVTLAHAIWLARARGDRAELLGLADAAASLADSEPGGEIWMAGASLLAADVGRYEAAAERAVTFARRIGGFDRLRPGAHRVGVLGVAASVAAGTALHGGESPFTPSDLEAIVAGLAATDCRAILIGWPTLVLGPVDRFRALALAAMGEHGEAEAALALAATVEAGIPAMEQDGRAFAEVVEGLRKRSVV